jgi:hypothetical protein
MHAEEMSEIKKPAVRITGISQRFKLSLLANKSTASPLHLPLQLMTIAFQINENWSFFPMAQQPLVGQGLLTIEAS